MNVDDIETLATDPLAGSPMALCPMIVTCSGSCPERRDAGAMMRTLWPLRMNCRARLVTWLFTPPGTDQS